MATGHPSLGREGASAWSVALLRLARRGMTILLALSHRPKYLGVGQWGKASKRQ